MNHCNRKLSYFRKLHKLAPWKSMLMTFDFVSCTSGLNLGWGEGRITKACKLITQVSIYYDESIYYGTGDKDLFVSADRYILALLFFSNCVSIYLNGNSIPLPNRLGHHTKTTRSSHSFVCK